MSLALSRLTERDERHYDTPDRDLIGAIASRVASRSTTRCCSRPNGRPRWLPEEPAAQAIPDLDAWRSLAGTCRETARDAGPGDPDPGGRRLVRHHPLARRVGIVIGDVEAGAREPRRSWVSCVRRCARSRRTRNRLRTSCGNLTIGAGRWPGRRERAQSGGTRRLAVAST